tara:strand:+ start:84 stop:548 length:465 start_codon:yes stop_codon:yes gene_type:complete
MENDKFIIDILKAYVAQTESAMQISKIISEHSNEEEISPDSVVIGLIYRLMIPMEENELKEALDFAGSIFDASSSEDDSEEYDNIDEIYEDSITQDNHNKIFSRKIKMNNCNCSICSLARECISNYNTHEINDTLAQKFKDAIDNTLKIHKLNL